MTRPAGDGARRAARTPCPICRKPADDAFAPFCSQRCADIDLGRWLGERYAIPGPDDEPGEDADEAGARSVARGAGHRSDA